MLGPVNIVTSHQIGSKQTACKTIEAQTGAVNGVALMQPEFCGFQEARQLFGLSRSHLYRLADEGRIKSVVLRGRGKLRGRRLFVVESIRALLLANIN